MTIIELMIAMVVLVVGLLGVITLFAMAIGNNGRSKLDTSSTMLAQAVIEQINAVLAGGGPGSLRDCAGNTWTISITSGAAPNGAGAKLTGSGIDFSETTPPDGYHMNYITCSGSANNVRTTYDVRWNIVNMSAGGTYLVTVGSRPSIAPSHQFSFALPVSLRAYVGR